MNRLLFNIELSLRAIRTNPLRSWLTIAIISIGIMVLVGILTAIDGMKASVYSNFASMGVNTLQITNQVIKKKKHGHGGNRVIYADDKDISYDEARAFRDRFQFPALVGISVSEPGAATVHYRSEKTNPNVNITGVDETYLTVNDTKLTEGRNLSANEIQNGSFTCILGNGIAKKLFKKEASSINEIISIGDVKFRVVGVMESKGGSMVMDADNQVLIPLNTARSLYGGSASYLISVNVPNVNLKDVAAEEAEGLFRVIRKLPLGTGNNFSVTQNNDLVMRVLNNIGFISVAAMVIAIITLLGSLVGLMNIMLVSVAERTREIGVSKALGARSSTIKQQFLTESVIISLLGGGFGVVLGMLLGNLASLLFSTGFIVPWLWMLLGISMCALVGIVSGIYPAMKASRLDPIVALRYE